MRSISGGFPVAFECQVIQWWQNWLYDGGGTLHQSFFSSIAALSGCRFIRFSISYVQFLGKRLEGQWFNISSGTVVFLSGKFKLLLFNH